jgi:DNA-binding PadR family transcriptional regulator
VDFYPELKGEWLVAPRNPEIPNHHERQFMQRLEGAGWAKAFKVPSTPGFIEKLLTKGWIEKRVIDGRRCYRITDKGLAAKKMRI